MLYNARPNQPGSNKFSDEEARGFIKKAIPMLVMAEVTVLNKVVKELEPESSEHPLSGPGENLYKEAALNVLHHLKSLPPDIHKLLLQIAPDKLSIDPENQQVLEAFWGEGAARKVEALWGILKEIAEEGEKIEGSLPPRPSEG